MGFKDGDFPNYGPNDGSILYNFGLNDYRDLKPILNQLELLLKGQYCFDDISTKIDSNIICPENLSILNDQDSNPISKFDTERADPFNKFFDLLWRSITITIKKIYFSLRNINKHTYPMGPC